MQKAEELDISKIFDINILKEICFLQRRYFGSTKSKHSEVTTHLHKSCDSSLPRLNVIEGVVYVVGCLRVIILLSAGEMRENIMRMPCVMLLSRRTLTQHDIGYQRSNPRTQT